MVDLGGRRDDPEVRAIIRAAVGFATDGKVAAVMQEYSDRGWVLAASRWIRDCSGFWDTKGQFRWVMPNSSIAIS